ncbi:MULTISPECIES: ketopantoate reductase family protein [unclassified Anaeromyxobacter]|uniref:ketopantoate reductase family protein n=1 Tax=unclassified Anaeromyxobacter TaxID=2620896 RepID=UPI001F593916|nr:MULTISPECIES: ketopantoate reductase family protein [unclassified Anaeromyxobacter]
MRTLERVVICGAGAVGSAYAERFQDTDGADLSVVAGGERRERLLREGLTVNGRRIDVRVIAPGEPGPPADLLLVAVKHPQLAAAIEDVRSRVGERTIILPLLNGITSEAALARAFGAEKVLHAFVVGNDVVREGTHVRYANIGRLVFGAASNDRGDPRVVAVEALLARAGIPAVVPADILREQWWKFMLNVGVNQVSAVLRVPYRAFGAVPEIRELTRAAALEVVALSAREGIALGPEDVERIFPILATLAPGGKTSMLQDVEAGRKTEVEIFAGAVVELGRRHGIATPVNALLGTMIAALERLAGIPG